LVRSSGDGNILSISIQDGKFCLLLSVLHVKDTFPSRLLKAKSIYFRSTYRSTLRGSGLGNEGLFIVYRLRCFRVKAVNFEYIEDYI